MIVHEGISIGLAVFAELMHERDQQTDKPTHRRTDHATPCSV